ncbi:MAG: hypothetical protein KA296_13700 [Marinobacter sp.]|nr:hypothetical protein [Marinobacter sp.]
MARRPDSEALGKTDCPTPGCDHQVLVFRTKRRGHHLYARCPDCGPLQSTSKAAQAHFAKALDGSEPSQTVPAKPSQTVPEAEDYDPGEILDEPTEPTRNRQRSPFGLLLLVLAVGGGLLTLKA